MLVFDWCFFVVVFFALLSPRFVLSMDCGRVLIKYELRYIYLCICFFIYWASTLLTCCDRLVFRLLFLKLCLIFWSDVSSRYNLHARLGANDQVTNIQFADDAAAVLTRRYATSAFLSAPAVTALNWCKQRTRPRVEPSRLDSIDRRPRFGVGVVAAMKTHSSKNVPSRSKTQKGSKERFLIRQNKPKLFCSVSSCFVLSD